MNGELAYKVLQKALEVGVQEFCLCPSSRNAPLVSMLVHNPHIRCYYWFEERSAAFFALGRSRATSRPVAVITTSGTAAGELLPATMEAHYLNVPLLLITADRPRRFRMTGAPQSAEQVGLYGCYVDFQEDIAADEKTHLEKWQQLGPAHLNVCFEEPLKLTKRYPTLQVVSNNCQSVAKANDILAAEILQEFLDSVGHLLVVVSALHPHDRESVAQFLLRLKAPVYLEGTSGLQHDLRLDHLRITRSHKIWQVAESKSYAIDGILRIGGVPTVRLWRDLEDLEGRVKVCSLSRVPFSGLSWGACLQVALADFLKSFSGNTNLYSSEAYDFSQDDFHYRQRVEQIFIEEPAAETSLIHQLTRLIPSESLVYLGNSLPIREWDLAALGLRPNYEICASRGVNGIDGQIATFLGLCRPGGSNWAIIGDLTALYDMVGPWILSQLNNMNPIIVVINNSGGQIFSRMYDEKEFLHEHQLNFEPLARMWQMDYSCWKEIPSDFKPQKAHLIEIIPDPSATNRFWNKLLT